MVGGGFDTAVLVRGLPRPCRGLTHTLTHTTRAEPLPLRVRVTLSVLVFRQWGMRFGTSAAATRWRHRSSARRGLARLRIIGTRVRPSISGVRPTIRHIQHLLGYHAGRMTPFAEQRGLQLNPDLSAIHDDGNEWAPRISARHARTTTTPASPRIRGRECSVFPASRVQPMLRRGQGAS